MEFCSSTGRVGAGGGLLWSQGAREKKERKCEWDLAVSEGSGGCTGSVGIEGLENEVGIVGGLPV